MTSLDDQFERCVKAVAFYTEGVAEKPQYYALSNDEFAIYIGRPRITSPGVIILNRNGTWRYDTDIPANDPMVIAKREL